MNIEFILWKVYFNKKCLDEYIDEDPLQSDPVRATKKHKGLHFSCENCDHLFMSATLFKEHVKSDHEVVRYPCDRCEYIATLPMLRVNMKV